MYLCTMTWKRWSAGQIRQRVFDALGQNKHYKNSDILGLPGTQLDEEVFYDDASFLKQSPFLQAFITNPNHIGVHTFGNEHEPIFAGTQQLEQELMDLCATSILGALPGQTDGYVASGGTEANIQAVWIYRNYFMKSAGAQLSNIALMYTSDAHYSMPKAANLLGIDSFVLQVEEHNRKVSEETWQRVLMELKKAGKKCLIVVQTMSTTLHGSVDDVDLAIRCLKDAGIAYKLHVDAAFGGFIYPFTNPHQSIHFGREEITSFTLDGHKMLQAPYGTGIFLIRKNWMPWVCTDEANYVPGKDYTLCGSRSGANAVSLWMILHAYGYEGWKEKMMGLIRKTERLTEGLMELKIPFFNEKGINIVAMRASHIPEELANRFYLVPDRHDELKSWYKVVLMPHVGNGKIDEFLTALRFVRPVSTT